MSTPLQPAKGARPGQRRGLVSTGRPRTMVVAGVMSGTSADGVDVALCRISLGRQPDGQPGKPALPRLKLLAHHHLPYLADLRAAVLGAMDSPAASTGAFARLSWHLGEVYAEAVAQAIASSGLQPSLVALHGQTLFHQAVPAAYLGQPLRCTWQAGEPAVVADRLRLPVVSDFRTADLAAGGQGAPLVPMLDLCLYRHPTRNRILLNLGGIANLTALPAGAGAQDVLAFDTGPANMVIDACMQQLYGRAYDCGGSAGACGTVVESVLQELLAKDPFQKAAPPRSCGREQYGVAFAAELTQRCEAAGARRSDVVATATAYTAETILEAYRRFVWPHLGQRAPGARATDIFVSGGGAYNAALIHRLRASFASLGCKFGTTAEAGTASLPVEAKEAAAFALLGWLTWHGLPGNLPAATGARRTVVLGRVSLV